MTDKDPRPNFRAIVRGHAAKSNVAAQAIYEADWEELTRDFVCVRADLARETIGRPPSRFGETDFASMRAS